MKRPKKENKVRMIKNWKERKYSLEIAVEKVIKEEQQLDKKGIVVIIWKIKH